MALAARKIDTDAPALTDEQQAIIAEVAEKPSVVLVDESKFNAYLAAVRAQVELEPGDMSTAKGRDIIKANAAGVARKKTAIDNARKSLTEDWRKKTARVNEVGKIVVEKFDALRDEVRAPLTEWEQREDARKAEADRLLELFRTAAIVRADETAADVQARLDDVRGNNLNDELFGARLEMATDLRNDAIAALQAAIERIKAAEAERAELQRLRDEAEQRRQADEARVEREREELAAKERAGREAAAAEEAKQAEAARIERAREEAIEQAQREAEAVAEEERQRIQREQDEVERKREYARQMIQHIREVGLGMIGGQRFPYGILIHELTDKIIINDDMGDMQEEVRAVKDATLAAVTVAMERAQERADREDREAEERRIAAAQAQREADLEHRSNVMRAAKEALMASAGLAEAKAKAVVLQIAAGNVPHVSIAF